MPVLSNVITGGLRMAKNLSKAGRKRIPMTSKMGNKNFYKGKGATKEGRVNSKGATQAAPLLEPPRPALPWTHVCLERHKRARTRALAQACWLGKG